MLSVKCDFCGKDIISFQNKTKKAKKFRLEENICNKCKSEDLNKKWEEGLLDTEKGWERVVKEKKHFFNKLLEHQKKDWFEEKKKLFFGSFFNKGVE